MPNSDVTFVPGPGFIELTRLPTGDVGKYLIELGGQLRLLAARQVHKRTGRLAASITSKWDSDGDGQFVQVGSSNKIALIHHNGTRPHLIVPHHTRLLRFSSHGKIVYARAVRHPGTKPNRYLTDNLRRVVK